MAVPEVRDWPVWKWTVAFAAIFLGGGVLDAIGEWAKQYLGPNAPFILWAVAGGVALGLFFRHRLHWDDRAGRSASSGEEETSPAEGRERRFKLGLLLALILVFGTVILLDGTVPDVLEALRSLRSSDWPVVAVLLAHVALLAMAYVVSLTDDWPVYTAVALAAVGLITLSIPDPNASFVAAAVLLVTGAGLLTLRSRKASLWFCGVAGAEWFLWTIMMNGAETYDSVHGLAGVLFAGVTAFLAWQFGPRLETA